ncbi:MAG: HEAT repeat domain-containing protein, partial [Planctomycetes bacterium]|nr:HEAT repeat domain-containing protein [Planctomycetota bacterium]
MAKKKDQQGSAKTAEEKPANYADPASTPEVGRPARSIGGLAKKLANADPETAQTGKRVLWQVVHTVGGPGNDRRKGRTVEELLKLLDKSQPTVVKREAIWALSELAGDEAVDPVAALLADEDLREDARMVLQRLPGDKSLAAHKAGLEAAPEEFYINIAESLRARGVDVHGLPDEKL